MILDPNVRKNVKALDINHKQANLPRSICCFLVGRFPRRVFHDVPVPQALQCTACSSSEGCTLT